MGAEAVFMAVVVHFAVAHFAVAVGSVEGTAAAASAALDLMVVGRLAAAGSVAHTAAAASARELMVEAPTAAARPWAAEALHLAALPDSGGASMPQVVDTEDAADTELATRSRTATGILSGVPDAFRMQEVRQDFAIPQLLMADGTRSEARTQV